MRDARGPGRPPILDQIAHDRHAVIEASAGTGKTHTLEHLVVDLLLSTDTGLESILIVTFTERAAGELRSRLRSKLQKTLDAEVDPTAKAKLNRALTSFDLASISTIHAFCQRMLLDNAFSAGRLFEQELVDGKSLFSRAFLTALRTRIAPGGPLQGYLDGWLRRDTIDALESLLFDCHQKRGFFRPEYAPDRLRDAALDLVRTGVDPARMRAALADARVNTSTGRALVERYERLLEILRGLESEKSLPRFLAALTDEEGAKSNGFLDYIAKKAGDLALPDPAVMRTLAAVARLAESLPSFPCAVAQTLLPIVREVLERDKKRSGQLDFDDMLGMLWESLEGAEGHTIAEAMRERFRYALVDEFQDTDDVQWSIFRRLFLEGGPSSAERPGNVLYVIGDPKQAIYGFRGADVHTYLKATDEIAASGGVRISLTENHRSDPRLVEAINLILDQSVKEPFFSGEIRYDLPVRPALEPRSERPAAHIFQLTLADSRQAPAVLRSALGRRIAEEILSLLNPASGPARAANEIFVLTHTAKEGADIGRCLRALRIPHAFYKQEGLFQTDEAAHIRDLLLAIADPHRRSARFRAWLSPFFAVPLDSLAGCLDLPASHPHVLRLFDWKALADAKDYSRLFNRIIEDSGIIKRELFLDGSERALTDYLHIFEILLEEASRSRATIDELIHSLSAFIADRRLPEGVNGNVQRLESERAAVQIMTMHKAKGLEAEVVFVFGGLESFPNKVHVFHQDGERVIGVGKGTRNPLVERERREEDQRLLYVAITRAKDRLYLPYLPPAPSGRARISSGPYRAVNATLERIVSRLDAEPGPALFSKEELIVEEAHPSPPVHMVSELLARWEPPPELLAAPLPRSEIDRLRSRHLGFTITSYSRIKALAGGYHPPDRAPADPQTDPAAVLVEPGHARGDDTRDELEPEVDSAAEDEAGLELPGGAASGRFIHEALERVDLEHVRDAPSFEFWSARKDVRELFLAMLKRHDRDPAYLRPSQELVFAALSLPLRLDKTVLAGGIARASRTIREMEFLYPIPEPAQPRPDERGFIKGYIDLVFEHDRLTYIVDWKSDLLPSYAEDELLVHARQNYALQGDLYTLALIKMLELDSRTEYDRRFGGILFCFVRGMQRAARPGEGVLFLRPGWNDVLASKARLVDLGSSEHLSG